MQVFDSNREIILASASPRRRELLALTGAQFRVVTADIDETPLPGEAPREYTLRLAEEKARAVLARHPESLVIGADTTVVHRGIILGKPLDAQDAIRILHLLQNDSHQVMTGVAVVQGGHVQAAVETTNVFFGLMSIAEAEAYVATGEPMDKAGAYALQGRAAQWIRRIDGDYTNVVGLPMFRLRELLAHF